MWIWFQFLFILVILVGWVWWHWECGTEGHFIVSLFNVGRYTCTWGHFVFLRFLVGLILDSWCTVGSFVGETFIFMWGVDWWDIILTIIFGKDVSWRYQVKRFLLLWFGRINLESFLQYIGPRCTWFYRRKLAWGSGGRIIKKELWDFWRFIVFTVLTMFFWPLLQRPRVRRSNDKNQHHCLHHHHCHYY